MTENCNDCKHEKECNHTEKYDYTYDKIMDYQTNKEYNSFKDICDLLNEQEELIKRLKQIREEQIETILKQKRKIKELTTQLQTEEDDVCIKCKHHYLTKKDPLHDAISNGEIVPFSSPLTNIEPYYISKCKKGHVECSKEDIRYCEDFELTEDDENE